MNDNTMVNPMNESPAGPAPANPDQNDSGAAAAQPTVMSANPKPKPQSADGGSVPEPGAESDTVHSGAIPETPSSSENSNAGTTTETNTAQLEASNDGNKNGAGDNTTTPSPAKEKRRRNRASPKKDAEDHFRVAMGMLPHSRNAEVVTDKMRKALEGHYDMLAPRNQMEFVQCLHSSIPDSVEVHGVVEDKDGEGKRVRELLTKK